MNQTTIQMFRQMIHETIKNIINNRQKEQNFSKSSSSSKFDENQKFLESEKFSEIFENDTEKGQ